MKRKFIIAAWLVATFAPPAVMACGVCIEDRVAATYDHAIITAAIAKRQQVVFVGIDGPVAASTIGTRIAAAARRVPGLKPGTLRTSGAPLAFSFALDESQKPDAAVAGFQAAVADTRARLTVMRVIRNGKLMEP